MIELTPEIAAEMRARAAEVRATMVEAEQIVKRLDACHTPRVVRYVARLLEGRHANHVAAERYDQIFAMTGGAA